MPTHHGYTLRYVDGFKIRNTLDDDFGIIARRSTLIAHFAPKYYIPENELWVDAPFHAELDFLLQNEFYTDDHPIFRGTAYHKLREHLKRELCLPGPAPTFIQDKQFGDPCICLVNGSIVRKYLDPDFIFGGHGYVYSYIPKNEIWLDYTMNPEELPFIECHEKVEREEMMKGLTYDEAHDIATAHDKKQRRATRIGFYPGDEHYPWYGKSNQELLEHYYIQK
jgi:hypothetical protein